MSEVRIFLAQNLKPQDIVEIPSEEAKHLKVRRKSIRDTITILNGKGMLAKGLLCVRNRVKITEVIENTTGELPVEITLYIGILKSDKMDLVIQKATELGVKRIVPTLFPRCVAQPHHNKLKRWRKIAIEAIKQSGRTVLPEITEPIECKDIAPNCPTYLFWEKADLPFEKSLRIENDHIALIVGPEGGISEEEAEELKAKGVLTVGLGSVILRSETAALYGISAIRYLCLSSLKG